MKELVDQGKVLLALLFMMVMSGIVIWFSLNDQLHAGTLKGAAFEAALGTGAYNAVWLYGAMFTFIACTLIFLVIGLAALMGGFTQASRALHKQTRRAAWEAKQAEAGKGPSDGAA